MCRAKLWSVLAAVGLALVVPAAWAATQARIAGKVTDSLGTPIEGAVITITCAQLPSFSKKLTTDDKGTYKVLILDATKRYRFHIEATGYAPHQEPIKVGVGSMDNEINFTLRSQQEMQSAQVDRARQQPGYKELEEGYELIEQGKPEEARDKLREAATALPDLVQAWTALAELDYQLGDYEGALADAERCLGLEAESASCLAVAANACNKLGREEEHHGYMTRYQAANPDDPATLFNQAVEHLNAMDDEKARPFLEQCLEVDPQFGKCIFEYGMLLLRAGDLAGAKAQLEHYLEIEPDGDDAETARETVKYL